LGNIRHGTNAQIRKDLKIKSYIDCTCENNNAE
jgi:hypothetical protein